MDAIKETCICIHFVDNTLSSIYATIKYLINHFVLKNGALGHNFHGHTLAGLRVPRKLNLGECSLPDGSAHLILPNLSQHTIHVLSKLISRNRYSNSQLRYV